MSEAIKIKPAEFWLWADTVMLTLSAPSARIVYIYGRYANEHREAWPARETIAGQVGSSVRSVSRALSEAKAANLLTVRERKRGYLSPVYTLTLPDGVGLPARPKNREDRSVTPRGQICHVERTDLATNQNQGREPRKRIEEREGSITQRPIGDGAKAIGGAAAQDINNEEQDMNSDEMRRAIREPLPEYEPQVPAGCRIVIETLPAIDEVTITEHRVAWRASNAEGRHWPGNWTEWAMQFLPYITRAQHAEWMAEIGTVPNVPAMRWHTLVVHRILSGGEKPSYDKSKPRFGGDHDAGKFGGNHDAGKFGGEA